MTGGVVSLTVMICVQLAGRPEPSVAVQVRVIVLLQLAPGLLCVSLKLTGRSPLQLSCAVTVAGVATSLKHWKLASSGQPFSTGGVSSTTTTSNMQEAV